MNSKHKLKKSQVKNINIPSFLLKNRKKYNISLLDCYVYAIFYSFGLVRLATGDEKEKHYLVKVTIKTASELLSVTMRSIYRSLKRLKKHNLIGQNAETYRKGSYVQIPGVVLEFISQGVLTLTEALFLSYITFRSRSKAGICTATYTAIGKDLGYARNTAKFYCIHLSKMGFTSRSFTQKTSKTGKLYTVAASHAPTTKIVDINIVPATHQESFTDLLRELYALVAKDRAPPEAILPAFS